MRAAALVSAAVFSVAANAYPEGAPWGAANPAADESCSSCHFGSEPVMDSAALAIEGLPDKPVAGSTYEFVILFSHADAVVSGFQLIAAAQDGDAGTLLSQDADLEYVGAAIRSMNTRKVNGEVSWKVSWQAPNVIRLPLFFYLAASDSNDDLSPFGDTIHYKQFIIADD